jgi:hypothetical protein
VSATTSASRSSTVVGIAVGVVLLGLMAAFAIGLPKTVDSEAADTGIELSLPDTLPGGYAAADDPASFEGGQLAEQADAIAKQQQDSTAYGNKVLHEVLGTSAVTRSYVVEETKAVFVQVIQAPGGAFAPSVLTDPAASAGAGGTTMKAVGDGVCILTFGQSQPGEESGDPVSSECQVSRGELTAQVQSNEVAADDLVELADQVLAGIRGDGQDQ